MIADIPSWWRWKERKGSMPGRFEPGTAAMMAVLKMARSCSSVTCTQEVGRRNKMRRRDGGRRTLLKTARG